MVRKSRKIDKDKIYGWLKENGLTQQQVSEKIGKSRGYLSVCLCHEEMAETAMIALESMYGLPASYFDKKESVTPELPVGYSVSCSIQKDKVRFAILWNGEEVYKAYANIREDTEVSLLKAISYAAHLCYKFAGQKEMEG